MQAALEKALAEQDWDEMEEEYEEDEAEYDAEAEEIAKRLGDQLWADIAKAQAEVNATVSPETTAAPEQPEDRSRTISARPSEPPAEPAHSRAKKQEAALVTVRTILSFAYKDPVVRATLAAHILPATTDNRSVLDVLTQCATANSIQKDLAKSLSEAVVSLAKSDVLFSSMRNSDAPAIQLDKGKRKRDHTDDEPSDDRYAKKASIEYPDILAQVTQAVGVITSAFSTQPATNGPPDPSLVASIQFPLHQVHLFCVTSAPRARPDQTNALQELGALIQMLGVLSKVHIGPAHTHWGIPPAPPDIGTAVYPCLVPGCMKTFYRLYSLRTHQRLHALVDRPYRCPACPASFQRNHDLKRHAKLHDKTAWKCGGCGKIFSRRDAIKRHKDSRGRGGKGAVDIACATAEVEEVEVDKDEGEEDASRRAKIWSGIVANQIANANNAIAAHVEMGEAPGAEEDQSEEGEVPGYVLEHAQMTALQLYPVIKSRVAPAEHAFPQVPPTGHHSTLASVMARTHTQYQNPSSTPPADAEPPVEAPPEQPTASSAASISLSWLSDEQTKLLEEAIAQAAAAARAQAEAEAALEEGDEDEFDEDETDAS